MNRESSKHCQAFTNPEELALDITASQGGFVEVYVYNASSLPVWYDQFSISSSQAVIIQENHYYPFGMQIAGLELDLDSRNRYLYNGKELQDDHNLDWHDYGARMYDAQIGRWHVVDPMADQAPDWTPYRYGFNNPINYTDPTGLFEDWFQDEDGNIQWFDNSSEEFSDTAGKSWSNIGTELIEFDGTSLTYNWQTGNQFDGYQLHSVSFDAVSGQGMDLTGFWNQTRAFDYSDSRQTIRDVGPVPEGNYSINKREFVPGSNESGFQDFSDISLVKQLAAPMGFSNWPGGTSSWGNYRWKLQNEGAQTFGRDNFYLHGGSLWGSRGCIDCGVGINAFTRSFMSRDLGNDKIFIKVKYPQNLRFQIQNNPTNKGINFISR
ncbi:RHS repeat domain-containing protein [Peijinzhouia sedimentorum]